MTLAYRYAAGDTAGFGRNAGPEIWISDARRDENNYTIHLLLSDGSEHRLSWNQWFRVPNRVDGPEQFVDSQPVQSLRCGDLVLSPSMGAYPWVVEQLNTVEPGARLEIIVYHAATRRRLIVRRLLGEALEIDRTSRDHRLEPEENVVYRHEKTHARFAFERHAHGRGRWPKEVVKYDAGFPPHPAGQVYRCRWRSTLPRDLVKEGS